MPESNHDMGLEDIGSLKYFFWRIRKQPHVMMPGIVAWLKGWWYRIKLRLMGKKFHAGKFFRVYGSLHISGPGEVSFGDNCLIISNAIKPVCIRMGTRNAKIRLGNNCGLNGTSILCTDKIEIGDFSNIADAYITDSSSHSLDVSRRLKTLEDASSSPVCIGKNVWVSVQVVILSGVTIGDNSVIGASSLVKEDVPDDVFAAGNPLKILKKIED